MPTHCHDQIADVSAVNMKKEIAVKKSEQEIQRIQDAIHLEHEKALSDAEHYRSLKRAEAAAPRVQLFPKRQEALGPPHSEAMERRMSLV